MCIENLNGSNLAGGVDSPTAKEKSDFYYYNIAHYGSLGTPCITMQGAPPGDWEKFYRYGSLSL